MCVIEQKEKRRQTKGEITEQDEWKEYGRRVLSCDSKKGKR